MPDDSTIFHIATETDVEQYRACGEYHCASIESEGFIHCCEQHQLAGVVSRYYEGIDQLQLLLIDPDTLTHALIRENTVGGDELFPHVYGPINADAIKQIVPFGLGSIEREGLLT